MALSIKKTSAEDDKKKKDKRKVDELAKSKGSLINRLMINRKKQDDQLKKLFGQ